MRLDRVLQEVNVCKKENQPKTKPLEIPTHRGIEDEKGPGEQ